MDFYKAKPGVRFVEILHRNVDEGYLLGEPEIMPLVDCNTELLRFKRLVRVYGRCTGKVYRDPDGKHVGYVFIKRQKYEDCNETYLHETWVTYNKVIKPAQIAEVKGISPATIFQEE